MLPYKSRKLNFTSAVQKRSGASSEPGNSSTTGNLLINARSKGISCPLEEEEEKAVSNRHIRNALLAPCVMVGNERGGGWT